MTRYLLDANVFIQANNAHYGIDFCPAFWDWLGEQNIAGKVASIEEVEDELKEKKDEVSQWADQCGESFFIAADEAVVEAQEEVVKWANLQSRVQVNEQGKSYNLYKQGEVKRFLTGADSWLIARAKAYNWDVVTHETPELKNKNKSIKIPDVCDHFQVRCIDPFAMLSEAGASFVLGP